MTEKRHEKDEQNETDGLVRRTIMLKGCLAGRRSGDRLVRLMGEAALFLSPFEGADADIYRLARWMSIHSPATMAEGVTGDGAVKHRPPLYQHVRDFRDALEFAVKQCADHPGAQTARQLWRGLLD